MRELVFSGVGFDLPLIQSDVIPAGFHHGFTTRRGGVSEAAPFQSLNLGGRAGDSPPNVEENRRRLQEASGGGGIRFATQVHGADCVVVASVDAPEAVARAQADAVIARIPGAAVGVYVADCVPVLIADVRTGMCAAVHAGWRGVVAGVLSATLSRMIGQLGARSSDLRVAIGPSIGPCCFEVGPEVVAAVEDACPGARTAGAVIDAVPRPHVDLWRLNALAALSVGVARDAIDVASMCTSCSRERFFSYRRDRGVTGQMAAFIRAVHDPRSATP